MALESRPVKMFCIPRCHTIESSAVLRPATRCYLQWYAPQGVTHWKSASTALSNEGKGSARWSLQSLASEESKAAFTAESSPPSLIYQGVIFDMDGTLSVSCIDYMRMRQLLEIPVGDLFTVMETWKDGERIKRSLDTILEIEAEAAAATKAMPGLEELLEFLRRSDIKVGLVTRNTTKSVDAFFDAIGTRWKGVFDIILTRENSFVKPDKRCLLHFASEWHIPPYRLLMVGDSTEDVECGNAAGTATCLIAGGGNEVTLDDDDQHASDVDGSVASEKRPIAASSPSPIAGAVPTFTVESLNDLLERLQRRDTPLGWGAYRTGTLDLSDDEDVAAGIDAFKVGAHRRERKEYSVSSSLSSSTLLSNQGGAANAQTPLAQASRDPDQFEASYASEQGSLHQASALGGAPPPGLEFLDWLLASSYVEAAACSFPRLDAARFEVPPDEHPGSKVLHIQCQEGALTKLLFSAGLLVVGVDQHVHAATKRGLFTVSVTELSLPGSLQEAEKVVGAFDAVVLYGNQESQQCNGKAEGRSPPPLEDQIWMKGSLEEIRRVLKSSGTLCVETLGHEAMIRQSLSDHGYEICVLEIVARGNSSSAADRIRVVAQVPPWKNKPICEDDL